MMVFLHFLIVLLTNCVCAANFSEAYEALETKSYTRALFSANILHCFYNSFTGVFDFELLWQSGNSIETLSMAFDAIGGYAYWEANLENTFNKTDEVVDNCYDDNQWWLLGWISAYEMTGNLDYLNRAANAFDYVLENAWTDHCGGGVMWCPQTNPQNEYKNAITNELFLTAAMYFHKYENILNKVPNYYLNWASREWDWFSHSGLINSDNLINDGLDPSTCQSNMQTTWTYNQGVLLDGLALLSQALKNSTILSIAEQIALAAMTNLTSSPEGILEEPCEATGCNHDQQIFKGVFVRHLGKMLPLMKDPIVIEKAKSFLAANADAMLVKDSCSNGGYGLYWNGPASSLNSVAEHSAATDLLLAAARSGWTPATEKSDETEIGFGSCVDDIGNSMPQCYTVSVSEQTCREASLKDFVAYEYSAECLTSTKCRVFSMAASQVYCIAISVRYVIQNTSVFFEKNK